MTSELLEGVSELFKESVIESFHGFQTPTLKDKLDDLNDRISSIRKQADLRRKENRFMGLASRRSGFSLSPNSVFSPISTRSRGPVADLPRIQQRTIERAYKN